MFKMAMRCAFARASRRPRGMQLLKPLAIASCAQPPTRPFRRCISTAQSETATPKPAVKFTSETYPSLKRDPRFAQLTADHVNHFKQLLGTDAVLDAVTDPSASDEVDGFNSDWMRKYRGHGKLVLKPNSTEQVSQILGYCNQQKLAVVPQGGNTGLVGGSVPVFDEIVINLGRMNHVRHFDDVSGILVADAGCILEVVDHYLAERGYIFPLDLGAKGSCQIGGNVSTNAGGLRLLRYGSLHGSVLGLEVVLPDGTIMNDLIRLRKNNTGYDIKQLFIGAEGTIGVVTAVSIHCPQRPKAVNVAFLGLESYDKAQQAFREAKGQLSEILSAFELLDSGSQDIVAEVTKNRQPLDDKHPFYCLIETSGSNSEHDSAKLEAFLESVMEKEIVSDGVVAQDQTQVKALWAWREGVPECVGHWGGVYKYDVSIPLKDMYQLVEDTERRVRDARLLGDTDDHPVIAVVGYGHMGDANLHLNIVVRRYDEKVERVLEPWVYGWIENREGSISAEHGLGLAKKKYIDYTRKGAVVHMMKLVKQLYDPNGIMNPYKYI
ncbi:D-lactate dehydrogenase 2 [Magnaporthiopsis poae ATCC 64411]|uniref:D-2-hydroxyglutarate dehydrogenase, mitochondrial n=1 Tax=Magnaporthiopsis poae (strain ATCC 64411 / 73-15) TaxID=644358 RepID=A0A0C4DMV1_MAGP6|nr:D-lactate dehydrogenase 2 [Magnaporthiopsis poae ATCC 64411]